MIKKLTILASVISIASCVQNDVYNADLNEKSPSSDYFSFETSSEVNLKINYGYQDYSVPFMVYTTNPYNEEGIKDESITPIFGAFTDENSSFSGTVKLPAYLDKIYVCSDYIGIHKVMELNIVNNTATYEYKTSAKTKANITYDSECFSVGDKSMVVNESCIPKVLGRSSITPENAVPLLHSPTQGGFIPL